MADRTVTVKASGGDYDGLDAALEGEAGYDCVTAEGQLYIDCYNFEDTAYVYFSGVAYVTSSAYQVIIRAVDDHGGKYSTSCYRLSISSGLHGITIFQEKIPDLTLQGIQIYFHTAGNSGSAIKSTGSPSTGSMTIEDCIIILEDSSGVAMEGIRLEEVNIEYRISNTIIYAQNGNAASQGIEFVSEAFGWVYNCTIDDIAEGIGASGGVSKQTIKNTRITNVTSVVDQLIGTDSDYNLTDGTAPTNWGSNSIDSGDTPTIDYVDDDNATLTSRDYHLNSSSDSGYDAGTDLSGDSDYPISTDIDGNTRSRWDIGADEYDSGGAIGKAATDTVDLADRALLVRGGIVKILR